MFRYGDFEFHFDPYNYEDTLRYETASNTLADGINAISPDSASEYQKELLRLYDEFIDSVFGNGATTVLFCGSNVRDRIQFLSAAKEFVDAGLREMYAKAEELMPR